MALKFTWVLAGAAALALARFPGARAADDGQTLGACDSASGCLTAALTGLVGGLTGFAGSSLWG